MMDLHDTLRAEARNAPDSGIVDVMKHGFARDDVMPLWAGEGDLATPDFICAAATRALAAGETFYTYQRGLPDLREALSRYHLDTLGQPFAPDRFIITGGGMQAIHLAMRAVAGTGDSVVIPSPAWPNAAASAELNGATTRFVPMSFSQDGWSLSLEDLAAAIDQTTRAIFINSPCNPTGWVMPQEQMVAVLEMARAHDCWIIADEIYNRFDFRTDAVGGTGSSKVRTPSFSDISTPDDRILYVNTFSKNWAMTGWRIGWLVIPEAIGQTFENLIQYNTSGVAAFMQRAALTALQRGDDFVEFQIDRARRSRALICDALGGSQRILFAPPDGAFYAFFAVDGLDDTRELAFRLIDEAGIGNAPGTAFGPGGERFMRMCFARSPADMEIALDRLTGWLKAH